jgi:predicted Zn-dependent peptidase
MLGAGWQAHARPDPNSKLERSVKEFKLDNGMKWFLVQRHQAPVFSGVVMIRVGGTDEVEGKAGLAHMLEHMAFKGTKVIGTRNWKREEPILEKLSATAKELSLEQRSTKPDKEKITHLKSELKRLTNEHEKYYLKNEVWEIMNRNGAMDLNAFTSKDVTAYHASMPINRLELWAAMLSQIVAESVFREFYTERDVVTEERRSGIDNNPDGKMAEILLQSAFQKGPYQWSTAGPEEDIQAYLLEDAKAFQEKYYVPSQMVGVLVGDIEIDTAKKVITEYFGKIPAREAPPEPKVLGNTGGGTVKFSFDAQPSMLMAFHKPTLPNPEEYIFDVVTTLLCDGPTSRLYRKLVIEKRVANRVSCSDSYPGSRLPNLFLIWVEPMNGASLEKVQGLIEGELDRLKKAPVDEEELKRVRNKVAASFIFGLETNVDLAMALARFETIFNDWRLLITYPDHVAKVTQEDVIELAKKYLTTENRTIVERIKKTETRDER